MLFECGCFHNISDITVLHCISEITGICITVPYEQIYSTLRGSIKVLKSALLVFIIHVL